MLRERRKLRHDINSGSLADIAFLLLIFFLLTSSLDKNYSFKRSTPLPGETLPQPTQADTDHNMLTLSLNAADELSINGKTENIDKLTKALKDFILNPENNPNLSGKEVKEIKYLGQVPVSLGVITIKTDDNTSYAAYIRLNDLINKAFAEMKEPASLKLFNMHYDNLDDQRRQAVDETLPININE